MDNNNKKTVFLTLNGINVNGMTEKKKQTNGTTLTYLSWASAYQIAKANFNDLSYEVERNPETGLPYWYDPLTGYMVFTKVTINEVTHEMWLPVLDATNHAMKSEPYEVKTKYKTYTVPAASMADINRSIMRCLTKCLGMHGLALYIYQGEDIPSAEQAQYSAPTQAQPVQQPVEKAVVQPQTTAQKPAQAQKLTRDTRPVSAEEVKVVRQLLNQYGIDDESFICSKYKLGNKGLGGLQMYQFTHIEHNINKLKIMYDNEKQQRLADMVKHAKKTEAEMSVSFGDAIAPPQQGKDEDGEPIDLESLGLTEKDIQELTDLGKVFS